MLTTKPSWHIFSVYKETNAMNNAMEIVKAQTIISINGHEYKAEIVFIELMIIDIILIWKDTTAKISNRAISKLKNILSSVVEAEAGGMLSQDASNKRIRQASDTVYMLEQMEGEEKKLVAR